MKRIMAVLLLLCILSASVFPTVSFAEEAEPNSQAASNTETPQDNLVETKHTAFIQGKELT